MEGQAEIAPHLRLARPQVPDHLTKTPVRTDPDVDVALIEASFSKVRAQADMLRRDAAEDKKSKHGPRALVLSKEEIDRLKAMGICQGRKVMLVRAGDPLILRVLGSRIGLSARLAHRVSVSACADHFCDGERV